MNQVSSTKLSAAPGAQDRLGTRVAELLSRHSAELPAGAQERLRFAREQALQRARERAAPRPGAAHAGSAPWAPSWWFRALALMPLALLIVGLWTVDQHAQRDRVQAVAELDIELLVDEVHPVLYSDPGFAEFLRERQQ